MTDSSTPSSSSALVAEATRLREFLEEVWITHRDQDSSQYNACEDSECAWCEGTRQAYDHLLAALQGTEQERDKLRAARRIHELDNHHNAALCPYCTETIEALPVVQAQKQCAEAAAAALREYGLSVPGEKNDETT